MLKELRKNGVDTTARLYLKYELITLCNENNIAVEAEVCNNIDGWCGRPKGLLQTLLKRGFINTELVAKPSKIWYSKEGKNTDHNENGEVKEEYKYILQLT